MLQKSPGTLGGALGRLIPHEQRCEVVALIDAVVRDGARKEVACQVLELSIRTYQRWVKELQIVGDARAQAIRPKPAHALSDKEKVTVLTMLHSPEFASLPPGQEVPRLADRGEYLCSESSMYRILREHKQQHHRGRTQAPAKRVKTTNCATAPGQVLCWDITWLAGPAKGVFYYLYLMLGLFSRKIVGWEVHAEESLENASELLKKVCLKEKMR